MALNLVLNSVLTVATYVVALSVKHRRYLSHIYLACISCITAVLTYHDHILTTVIQGSPPSSNSIHSSVVISFHSWVLHVGALIHLRFIPKFNHIQNSFPFICYLLVIIILVWRKATKVSYYLIQCTIGSHSRSLSSWSLTVSILM